MITNDLPPEIEARIEATLKLQKAFMDATDDGDYDFDIIFDALQSVWTFHMSMVCPDCRKNVARRLRKLVPHMLAEANKFAAEMAAEDGKAPSECTHH